MLALERIRTEVQALPAVTRLGLVVLALGGLADVVAHLGPPAEVAHLGEHTADEVSAHLLGFLGMVVTLLGIVADGARRALATRSLAAPGGRHT